MMLFTSIAAVITKSCDETKHASRVQGHNAIKRPAERGVMNATSALEHATALVLAAIAVGACFAAALFVVASNVSAAQGLSQVNVQGEWAYTTRNGADGTEYWRQSMRQRIALASTCMQPRRAVDRLIDTYWTISFPAKAFLIGTTAIE
jgi:hypothetical protein